MPKFWWNTQFLNSVHCKMVEYTIPKFSGIHNAQILWNTQFPKFSTDCKMVEYTIPKSGVNCNEVSGIAQLIHWHLPVALCKSLFWWSTQSWLNSVNNSSWSGIGSASNTQFLNSATLQNRWHIHNCLRKFSTAYKMMEYSIPKFSKLQNGGIHNSQYAFMCKHTCIFSQLTLTTPNHSNSNSRVCWILMDSCICTALIGILYTGAGCPNSSQVQQVGC